MALITHSPIQSYCSKIITQFKSAKKSTNPALYLHKNKVRTNMFMIESILRVSDKLEENEQITEWHETIKKIEDQLGEIDHYSELFNDFSALKNIPDIQLKYISLKRDKAIKKLNQKLKKFDFYIIVFSEINKNFKINFNDKTIVLKFEEEIKAELVKAREFFGEFPEAFNDMEEQVHELRRKIRWVSIYAQSFDGLFTLKEVKQKYVWEKQFITKLEISNPFNKLPIKKNLSKYIILNKKAFFALSFMINSIGNIKDKGLQLYFLEKSIQKTSNKKNIDLEGIAQKQLQVNYSHTTLLKEAHQLFSDFFNKYNIGEIIL